MNIQVAYTAPLIFTGEELLREHAIVVGDDVIKQVMALSSLPSTIPVQGFSKCLISPAFIDLQIYGASDRLLAVYPDVESLKFLYEYCKKGGAAFCMPTVATNKKEVFSSCIEAIRKYWEQGGKGILGLHIEGPWINPLKRGAHIEEFIHSPTMQEVRELLDEGRDVIKIITLAPEVCTNEIVSFIESRNIIVSAGHSNATYDEAIESFDSGISTVTHLFNAMSPLQHRNPGLAGATMDHTRVRASIIPDGYHVDYAAIRIAKKVMGSRLFVITDAVTETRDGHYHHHLDGDKYTANGILSGSSLTMSKAVQNLVKHAHIELEEALRMCSLYPSRVIKTDTFLGKIKKGFKSAMVVLDDELNIITTIC